MGYLIGGEFVKCVQVVGIAQTHRGFDEYDDNELKHVGSFVLVRVVGWCSQ